LVIVFLAVFLDWESWVLLGVGIFLNVLVGGGGGVTGPKELMGWVDTVTDDRAYCPPSPRSTEVGVIVFYNTSKYCYDDIAKSY